MCFVLPKVNYEIYRKKIKRVPVGVIVKKHWKV